MPSANIWVWNKITVPEVKLSRARSHWDFLAIKEIEVLLWKPTPVIPKSYVENFSWLQWSFNQLLRTPLDHSFLSSIHIILWSPSVLHNIIKHIYHWIWCAKHETFFFKPWSDQLCSFLYTRVKYTKISSIFSRRGAKWHNHPKSTFPSKISTPDTEGKLLVKIPNFLKNN